MVENRIRMFHRNSPLRVFGLEFLSGLFFLSAMMVLVYFTAVINGAEWLSGRKPLILTVEFSEVGDLGRNSKVCFRGMQIGRVSGMAMSEDYQDVKVRISLDEPIKIYQDYAVTVRQSSVFGGSYMAIDAGTSLSGEIDYSKALLGLAPADLLHDATELVTALRQDEAIFRKEFMEGELLQHLAEIPDRIAVSVEAFQKLIDQMREGDGAFAMMINDSSLYFETKHALAQIGETAGSVNELSRKLTHGSGAAAKLLNDPEFYDTLLKSAGEFRQTLQELSPALKNFDDFSKRLASAEGSLGRLLADDGKLYDALHRTLNGADSMFGEVRESRGTLGLLIRDPALYHDVHQTVKQLRGAVEDFREQAPLTTFGSLMMGGL